MRIVCFPGAAYDFPLPTNRQQMMRRLAERGHEVLYVEPPRFPLSALVRPRPAPSALSEWLRRYAGAARRPRTSGGTLALHTELNPYPGADSGPLAPALLALNRRWTARAVERAGMAGAILWIYTPHAAWAARALPSALVIYDCVDDYAEQPGYGDIRAAERQLACEAGLVFASTQGLADRLARINPHTHLMPNVADYDHFARARSGDLPIPPELAGLPRPILGYVGALDRYKFDARLVVRLARAYEHASVVLIGPSGLVEQHGKPDPAMAQLQALPNVHLLGRRPYAELPAYLQCFDAGLIPYQRNKYTAECSPLKLHEYLAAGLPVAVAGLPSLRPFADVIALSEDGSDYLAAVARALADGPARVADRQAVAQRFTWDTKLDWAERLIHEALERR
jgi:hypothetical protein